MSQKALVLQTKHGAFVVTDRAIPKPAAGQVLVKIRASALNPLEWKIQALGIFLQHYPAVLGMDAAGDIEELGENVDGFSKGDRIFFQPAWPGDRAGYQQYAVVDARIAVKIPQAFTYSEASSISSGFMTAAVGLLAPNPAGAALNPVFDPSVRKFNKPALVIGGSGSVGQYAIQILSHLECSPIIAYASSKHSEFLKSLGATHIIDRTSVSLSDLSTTVNEIVSGPLDIVYDAVGSKEAQEAGYACLADGGQMPTVNLLKITEVPTKRIFLIWGSVFAPPPPGSSSSAAALWQDLWPFGPAMIKFLQYLVDTGAIVPNRVEELPNGLSGIAGGLERLKNNQVSGVKLVALPQEPSV